MIDALNEYKPWELYPDIWKTEAAFWTYLRGGLRRGLWEKSPIKLSYKVSQLEKPPVGYIGRAKSGAKCHLTGVWTGNSKLEVDHLKGNVSLRSWEDVLSFILHLVPPPNSLGLAEKEAHKIKSYSEKEGISFEEAVAAKKAIAIEKGKKVLPWFESKGIVPASNAKGRRIQMVRYFLYGEILI